MTISSTTRIAGPFTGNGVTTTFPFTYKVFSTADVQVIRLTISTGLETTLTIVTDYTITLNGDQDSNPGGNIVLVAALSALYKLTATSDIANLQPTDLTNQGGFYPEVITDALDRATIQIQQLADQTDRAIKIPISDGVLDMTTPGTADRASKYFVYDASGLPSVSSGSGTDTALRTDLANASVSLAGSRLSGFRQTGTGATARTVDAKLKDTVSVKDFGAVGDGTTDDSAAIQAAITATIGTLYFPRGTYRVNTRLLINHSNINLVGDGIDATNIYYYYEQIKRTNATANDGLGTPAFEQSQSLFGFKNSAGVGTVIENVGFSHMTLEYKATWSIYDPAYTHDAGEISGIHAFNVDNLSLYSIKIKKFNACGLRNSWFDDLNYSGSPNVRYTTNLTARNCEFTENHFAGIHLIFVDGAVIENCDITYNGPNLSRVSDGSMTEAEYYSRRALTGYGYASSALYGYTTQNIRIDNCRVIGNNRYGIDQHAGLNLVVTNNIIKDNIVSAVRLQLTPGGRAIVSDNIISGMNGAWNDASIAAPSGAFYSRIASYGGMQVINVGYDTSAPQVPDTSYAKYIITNNIIYDVVQNTPSQADTIVLFQFNTGQGRMQSTVSGNIAHIGSVNFLVYHATAVSGTVEFDTNAFLFSNNSIYSYGIIRNPFYFEEVETVLFDGNYLSFNSGRVDGATGSVDDITAYLGTIFFGSGVLASAEFRNCICTNNVLVGTGWNGTAYVDYSRSIIGYVSTIYQEKLVSQDNTINGLSRLEFKKDSISTSNMKLLQGTTSIEPLASVVLGGQQLTADVQYKEYWLTGSGDGAIELLQMSLVNGHKSFLVEVLCNAASLATGQYQGKTQKRVFSVTRRTGTATEINTVVGVGEYLVTTPATSYAVVASRRTANDPNPTLTVLSGGATDTQVLSLSATLGYTTSTPSNGAANCVFKVTLFGAACI